MAEYFPNLICSFIVDTQNKIVTCDVEEKSHNLFSILMEGIRESSILKMGVEMNWIQGTTLYKSNQTLEAHEAKTIIKQNLKKCQTQNDNQN
jgi:hypothetical protein